MSPAEVRISTVASWAEKAKNCLRNRIPKVAESDKMFAKSAGGMIIVHMKTDHMIEMIDRETDFAIKTLYEEAVAEEIRFLEYKKGLSYAKRRKLEEPRTPPKLPKANTSV